MSEVRVFGIRHHGPGSARSLIAALDDFAPDALLVEGPPDVEDELVAFAADPELVPPVALLVYAADEPTRAVHYPLASFSPEWQALRWALARGVPVKFMDLALKHELAREKAQPGADGAESEPEPASRAHDGLVLLARAAGYDDSERWWEALVEHRRTPSDVFAAILEAMTAAREELGPAEGREAQREAAMRQILRRTLADGHARVAVVCGAWHAPALSTLGPATHDAALLRGLPSRKVVGTWVPWTHGRLASESGYGAGVTSPGWYAHVFEHTERVGERWLARAARLLRDEDIDVSSAHVIEGVRLAEALAALRGEPHAGLAEYDEAVRAVFCFESDLPLRLVRERLVLGQALGSVPERVPALPLVRDVEQQQKSLRMKPQASANTLELDLREDNGRARSELLHRLRLVGVAWGEPRESRGKGTFKETWELRWQPEFAAALVAASRFGSTLASAASGAARERARETMELAAVCELLDLALLARLPDVLETLYTRIETLSAQGTDVVQLLAAVPPLARVARYGDVRRTDAGDVKRVLEHIVARVSAGLGLACASLDDEAARAFVVHVDALEAALVLLEDVALLGTWRESVAAIATQSGVHGLVAGRALRIVRDARLCAPEEVARRLGVALSPAGDPAAAAAWLEGFLGASGLVLLHDEELWSLVDTWICALGADAFVNVLPLVRRSFATFAPAERRKLGERVAAGALAAPRAIAEADWDRERGELVIPVLARILGIGGTP